MKIYALLVYFKNMNEELKLKLESNEFSAMYELVSDILMKVSGGNLYKCDNFQKMFSPYILCRYLSMRKELIDYANLLNTINTNSKLSNVQFYKLAYQLIPKQTNDFVKYIKKPEKQKKTKDNDEIINNIEEKSSIFEL